MTTKLEWLNALPENEAKAEFLRCCGATRWAARMAAARPFASFEALAKKADELWSETEPADWHEAFSHHPRIGDRDHSRAQATGTQAWSNKEQAGTANAATSVLDALRDGNRAYEQKFQHVFLICATGKSADEMLASLQQRMGHDADHELRVAAEEQRKIMQIRLGKLVNS